MEKPGKSISAAKRLRGRPRRHKPRLCRCCGREMEPTQVCICASCEAAEEPILEGWGLDEIEALARYLWDHGAKAYGTYGKLRGWCDNVGWLPPLPEGL